ncbi:hypothetical protein B0H10DRAFT_2190166 [Mycena sp. CBHHK59/15]|nr:hypothetical protein B0H10DRAFT_2190166 [Mycena sp. CBHHK59/15]
MPADDDHVKRNAKSQRLLQMAREKARKQNGYDSAVTRRDLARLFEDEYKNDENRSDFVNQTSAKILAEPVSEADVDAIRDEGEQRADASTLTCDIGKSYKFEGTPLKDNGYGYYL